MIALAPQLEAVQVFLGTFTRQRTRQTVVTRLGGEDVAHLLEIVEVEFLRHHADMTLGPGEVEIDICPENLHRAAALAHERADDADGGGLARAIGTQQGKKVALLDIEINTLQCR